MKLYLIEIKDYYKDSHDHDVQAADGGMIPPIYRTEESAIERAKKMVDYFNKRFGYKVVIPTAENPRVYGDCLYACRLENQESGIRREISVYETYTLD